VRFAYADPPYIGQALRHYSADPQCAEVDHLELILPACPRGYRVGVWVKSFCAFKRNVRPAYAWEPVIFWGGRNPMNGHRAAIPERNGAQTTPKEFIIEPITLRKGLVGAKPERVCRWILDLLNFLPGDELVDLYPGTGIMGKCAASVNGTVNPESPDGTPTGSSGESKS